MATTNLSASNLFTVPSLVAVITGGGTGIGLMMAKALAFNGAAKVYILGRRIEKLQEAAQLSPHGNIIPLQCDVTSKDALAAAATHIENETGFINLLIANSGTSGPMIGAMPQDPSLKQFKDFTWAWSADEFTNTFAVNNTAVFFTAIAFLELLDAGNRQGNVSGVSSQIIVTASIASFIRKVVSGFAYMSSKAGTASMTKSLSTMLAPYGIRCNGLAPGSQSYPFANLSKTLTKIR